MQENQIPNSHSQSLLSVEGRQKNTAKMAAGKLKDSLLSRMAALNPSISINSCHASFVDQRLQQLFNSSFHTPTHPPYASMIRRAITELNEENGSTEEAISEFIRKEYEDLPLAHVTILDLHLRRLCMDGVLVRTSKGRYRPRKRSGRRRGRRTERNRTTVPKCCEGERVSGMMNDQETKEHSSLDEQVELHSKRSSETVEEQQSEASRRATNACDVVLH